MFENPDAAKAQAKDFFQKAVDGAKWLWSLVPPLHPAGVPIVAAFAGIAVLLCLIWHGFFWIGVILTVWCAFFFRDPVRVTPLREGLVIAPADGLVSMIQQVSLPGEFDTEDDKTYTRVSIFLNVFDVHIQRIPFAGKIKEVVYRPGKFLNASLDKASEDNERSSTLIETTDGKYYACVQIAGLIARRIINDLKKDQSVQSGQRYGLIRFGSRVDLYLPEGVEPMVCVGQRTVGGETVIADAQSSETAREGIVR